MAVNDSGLYYDIRHTIEKFPQALVYIIFGGRFRGKTYSTLRWVKNADLPFTFIKRTNIDVNTLCSGYDKHATDGNNTLMDVSPFASLNADFGWNIQAIKQQDGLGAFYDCDVENNPISVRGAIVSLNKAGKAKGWDVKRYRGAVIFDEFVPNKGEKVSWDSEGSQVLDLYNTITRDAILVGEWCPLICLANATEINSPLINELGLTNVVGEMVKNDEHYRYIADRYILIERVEDSEEMMGKIKNSKLFAMTRDTRWNEMAFGNSFSYNDFSAVERIDNISGWKPVARVIYRNKLWILGEKGDLNHLFDEKHSDKFQCSKNIMTFDLNHEAEQKRFWMYLVQNLKLLTAIGRMSYDSYLCYDTVWMFQKFYPRGK